MRVGERERERPKAAQTLIFFAGLASSKESLRKFGAASLFVCWFRSSENNNFSREFFFLSQRGIIKGCQESW